MVHVYMKGERIENEMRWITHLLLFEACFSYFIFCGCFGKPNVVCIDSNLCKGER